MRSKKIQKLTLARETVRSLTNEDLSRVIGGAKPSQGCPSQGGSECPSVMLCPSDFCSTKIFC
jgi:hypothetical protein